MAAYMIKDVLSAVDEIVGTVQFTDYNFSKKDIVHLLQYNLKGVCVGSCTGDMIGNLANAKDYFILGYSSFVPMIATGNIPEAFVEFCEKYDVKIANKNISALTIVEYFQFLAEMPFLSKAFPSFLFLMEKYGDPSYILNMPPFIEYVSTSVVYIIRHYIRQYVAEVLALYTEDDLANLPYCYTKLIPLVKGIDTDIGNVIQTIYSLFQFAITTQEKLGRVLIEKLRHYLTAYVLNSDEARWCVSRLDLMTAADSVDEWLDAIRELPFDYRQTVMDVKMLRYNEQWNG